MVVFAKKWQYAWGWTGEVSDEMGEHEGQKRWVWADDKWV